MVNMGQEIRGEIFLSRVLCALQAAPLKIPLVFSRNKPTFQVTGHSAQSCQCSFWLRWCFPVADLYRTLTSYWLIINKGGCWPHRVTVDFTAGPFVCSCPGNNDTLESSSLIASSVSFIKVSWLLRNTSSVPDPGVFVSRLACLRKMKWINFGLFRIQSTHFSPQGSYWLSSQLRCRVNPLELVRGLTLCLL